MRVSSPRPRRRQAGMSAPLYAIPGSVAAAAAPHRRHASGSRRCGTAGGRRPHRRRGAGQSQVEAVMDELDRDLVGLAPVKQRIRDIAALLVIDRCACNLGLAASAQPAHVLHRQPRHRQDHGGAAHGADPASPGLCAEGPPGQR
jgi:hypothetical protein